MATIQIEPQNTETCQVTVVEGNSQTTHQVQLGRLGRKLLDEGYPLKTLLRESFLFLLENEPKESILAQFEIGTIQAYFPNYPKEIRKRMKGTTTR